MASLGKEIFRQYDEHGSVQVFDDGEKRYLAFGNDTEQSCILKSDAALLQYEYTRAMLLPLLFMGNPNTALILGLGAGSLVTCLRQQLPRLTITAIELRQSVADVAKRFFQLPSDNNLQVKISNADDYLGQPRDETFQLILSDIYGADDVDGLQLQEGYIDQCREHLDPQGWLVLNCWRHHRRNSDLLSLLKRHFGFVGACDTQAGNWVLIASNQMALPSRKKQQANAASWSKRLNFSLPLSQLEILQSV
ncbi:MAG: spermidine synthase [Cellvibrionaceae bacterium]